MRSPCTVRMQIVEAFANSGSLENECDARPHHRAGPSGERKKGSRCSVRRATTRWQVGLIECLHKNRPRQEAEGADDILLEPTIRADPQSAHHEGRTWMSPTP